MGDDGKNANKETKKTKEKTETKDAKTQSLDDTEKSDDDEEMGQEEARESLSGSLHNAAVVSTSTGEPESEAVPSVANTGVRGSLEERRRKAMRLKWLSVTGKKPLNIPITKRYQLEAKEAPQATFFGDRRPMEIERRRKEHWMKLERSCESTISFKNEGKVLHEIRFPDINQGLRCLRFSPRAENMVTSFGNGLVQVRKPDTGEVIEELKPVDVDNKLAVFALRYHPIKAEKVYAGCGGGTIYVFDVNEATCTGTVSQENNEISSLDVSSDGALLATGGRDGNIYIYDSESLEVITTHKRPSIDEHTTSVIEDLYHKMRIFAVKFHPTNPNVFVSGGWDNTVKIWDARASGGARISIRGPHICGDGIDVNEKEILTASWTAENSLKLWDLSSGELIKPITVVNRSSRIQGEFLYTGQFFKTGTTVRDLVAVGGSGCGRVEIISLNDNMVIAHFPAMRAVNALDSINSTIAYGGMETLFRIGELVKPPPPKKGKLKNN